jgi:hypothetical protein
MVPGEKITPPILDIYSVCENILLRAMRHLLRHRCYGESIISQSFLPSRAGRITNLRLNRQEAKTFVLLMGMVLRLSLFLWFSDPARFRLSCHGHQGLVALMLDAATSGPPREPMSNRFKAACAKSLRKTCAEVIRNEGVATRG